jgi:hypothetical protein
LPGRKSRDASCPACKDSASKSPSAYECICTYLLPTCAFQEHIHHLENTARHAMQKQSKATNHTCTCPIHIDILSVLVRLYSHLNQTSFILL